MFSKANDPKTKAAAIEASQALIRTREKRDSPESPFLIRNKEKRALIGTHQAQVEIKLVPELDDIKKKARGAK